MSTSAMSRYNGETHFERQGLWDPLGIEIPRHADWVAVARLAAAGIAYRAGLTYEGVEEVKVIVAECLSYCIQHGRPGGRLRLSFEKATDALVITVQDPTFSVATAAASSPKFRDESDVRSYIDGLFLIRGLAQNLEYMVSPTEGLTLRVRKNIA